MRGQLALVTGATGMIGRAIGRALREAGAEVLLQGRTPERVARLAAEDGPGAVAADLTRPEDIARLRDRVAVAGGGRLGVLTLGSGTYARGEDPDMLRAQLEANVTGPYALLRALLPFLLAAEGQVVFVNSSQGLRASGGVGQFAATQHAMRAIADSLREEVNARGVRVLSVHLGRTASERQRAIFAMEGRPYPEALLIQPETVAEAVRALLMLPRDAEATELSLRPMRKG